MFISAESKAEKLGDEKEGAVVVDKLVGLTHKILAGTGRDVSAAAVTEQSEGKKGGLGGLLSKLKSKS